MCRDPAPPGSIPPGTGRAPRSGGAELGRAVPGSAVEMPQLRPPPGRPGRDPHATRLLHLVTRRASCQQQGVGGASTVQNGVSAEREGAGGATFLELWLLRPSLESPRVVD